MEGHITRDDIVSRLERDEFADGDIRIDAAGTWFVKGEAVNNPMTALVLSRLVTRGSGGYLLSARGHEVQLTVEDAPLAVTEVRLEGVPGDENVYITLSSGNTEELDPSSLYFRKASRTLYCVTSGDIPARFALVPSIVLLDLLEEDEGGMHLRIKGDNWEIPRV